MDEAEIYEEGCWISVEANLAYAHHDLHHLQLVVGTLGNCSVRHRGFVLIKASGENCAEVSSCVRVTLAGEPVDKRKKPSSDTAAHLYIYNHLPRINAVVHTHSTFATAFAVAQKPVPCISTQMCDHFGGDIPLSAYCRVGGEDIGKEVVRLHDVAGAHAFLIRQHGVFTIGRSLDEAVDRALMVEDCARTIFHSMQLGAGKNIAPEETARARKRFVEEYGQ